MRLEENPQLPIGATSPYEVALNQLLTRVFRAFAQKANQIADGRVSAIDNALTSAPTTGQYQRGDFVRNSAPVEAGTAGSKYVVTGWICVAAGSPGTFVQHRALTGN
ncbi:hypothetical protein RD110_11010 [Rhodoferax koreense]|uniref:Uncharacterized protein n=1 Tax=Rhodoferax koreensis TaxID=1842727 RepID=A0A1P8JV52_9BURK|nr:hypothetical protein [Rhodoferax koreense]APW37656.1 hypothetical protein RD110_11010 [Rhodoferax koreense]